MTALATKESSSSSSVSLSSSVTAEAEEPHITRKERKEVLSDTPEKLSRTLFVGNVPVTAAIDRKTARDLKSLFAAKGPVESLRFRSIAFSQPGARKVAFINAEFRKNFSTCNAYVVMETREGAIEALSLNATIFADRHLRVDLAASGDDQSTKMNTKKSVFIGNLSMEIEEEPVWRFFGQVGHVTNVRLIRDKVTNLGKGIGYVTFASKDSVELALKLAGNVLEKRPIRISRCCKAGMVEKKKSRLARLADEKEKKRTAIIKTVTGKGGLGAAKTEASLKEDQPEAKKKLNKKEAKLQAELATKFGQLLHKKFPFSAAISSLDGKTAEAENNDNKERKDNKDHSYNKDRKDNYGRKDFKERKDIKERNYNKDINGRKDNNERKDFKERIPVKVMKPTREARSKELIEIKSNNSNPKDPKDSKDVRKKSKSTQ